MRRESNTLSILGLKTDLLNNPILSTHYSTEVRITEELFLNNLKIKDNDTWEEALLKLGFTEQKSKNLAEMLNGRRYTTHLTPILFAVKYINLQFRCQQRLVTYTRLNFLQEIKYQQKRLKLNITFVHHNDWHNFTDSNMAKEYFGQPRSPMSEVKYWFHGTDIEAAINILDNGIIIEGGNKKLCFSNGNGFYITSNLEFAYHWSLCTLIPSEQLESAIIIFEDNDKSIETTNNAVQLDNDSPHYSKVIHYFRHNKCKIKTNATKEEMNSIQRYDYIFGPIPTNNPLGKENEVDFQLCLRNQNLADKFFNNSKNIKEVIIFHRK